MNDTDLKALRSEVWFYNGLNPPKALALIDELTETRRERDDAKRREGDANEHLDMCVVARRERDEARAALARARAAAFEEAARCVASYRSGMKLNDGRDLHRAGLERLAEQVAALSATPATVVCVPVEKIRSIANDVEASAQHTHGDDCRGFDDGDDLVGRDGDGVCECGLVSARKALAALAEMAKVKP